MERLQPSGIRGDAAEGRRLGETLGHRRGQRARSYRVRRLHSVWPYNTLTQDGPCLPTHCPGEEAPRHGQAEDQA
jgi:hypothetical protein